MISQITKAATELMSLVHMDNELHREHTISRVAKKAGTIIIDGKKYLVEVVLTEIIVNDNE
jgi:hypothetical protein